MKIARNQFRLVSFLALCFLMSIPLQAQDGMKIYAVLCGQTDVFDIGKGCEVSVSKMTDFLEVVSHETEIPVEYVYLTGENYSKDNILSTLDQLDLENPDSSIIFFYATSHGFNYKDTPTRFAFLGAHPNRKNLTAREFNEFGMSLELDVHRRLMSKSARLTITIGEACNNVIDMDVPDRYQAMNLNRPHRLRELFRESIGDIISTSSKLDQFSWTDSKDGGIWTNQFLRSFDEITSSSEYAEWQEIFDRARNYTVGVAEAEAQVTQEPDDYIDIISTPMQLIDESQKKRKQQPKAVIKN
ncbi:MAG: caspase family protein [Saprospiraceae bacterium]|nr:caspase family protein [Saprospiraceae bacterium]